MSSVAIETDQAPANKKRSVPVSGGSTAAILAARRKKQQAVAATPAAAAAATEQPKATGEDGAVRAPVAESAATFESRLASAVRSTNYTFYPSTEVAARYAHAGPVREFLSTEGAEISSIVASMGRAAQTHTETLSRIDALITEQQNGDAAARLNYGRQVIASAAGLDPRTPAGALQYGRADGRALSIDEFAARVLGIDSIDAIGNDLLREPYQVNGLSRDEDNPEYVTLRDDRLQLELRREQLQYERARLLELRQVRGAASAAEEARVREELRQQLMLYAPIESVQLLKPASQVRELNERWRNLLGSALARIASDYQAATAASLAEVGGASQDALALYMERVRNPVLDRYVAELQQATFEDMPLTREQLESYFNRFIGAVVRAMVVDEKRLGEQALAEAREAQVSAAERYFAFGLGEDAIQGFVPQDLAPVPSAASGTTPADEAELVNAYLRDTLYVYATPEYLQWLDRWLADFTQRLPGALSDAGVDTLRRSVSKLIQGRDRMYRERIALLGRALPRYAPPTEAEMVRAYTELVTADVALARARTIVDQDQESTLRTLLQSGLRGQLDVLPLEVLLVQRVDRFEILEQERSMLERQIRETFVAPRGADERTVAFQERARDTSLGELAQRNTALGNQLLAYAPRQGADLGSRGPDDAGDNGATRYDLSYPLDPVKTERQVRELQSRVARQTERFDGQSMHERANSLRGVLSYSYAERMLQREILRINYALQHYLLPTRAAPLVLVRSAGDTRQPLVLTATIALRDELVLAQRAPDELLRDARIDDAERQLARSRFEVTWYFRPRHERADGSIVEAPVPNATQLLAAGERTARLTLYAGDNDSLVPLAGTYRAEFRLLEPGERAAVYKSIFSATVRVVARCRRHTSNLATGPIDFEVGSEGFGDCEWCEAPRDAQTHQFAVDLAILIAHGPDAVDEARVRRAEEARQQGADSGPLAGVESERDLQEALSRFDIEDFRYPRIFGRMVGRVGELVRRALLASPLAAAARGPSNLALVALLVDTSPVVAAARAVALAAVGASDMAAEAVMQEFQSVPNESIPQLSFGEAPADLERVPLLQMLFACLTPALWAALNSNERRFVYDLVRRFERFGFDYRQRAYETLREQLVVKTGNFLPVVYDAPSLRAAAYSYGANIRLGERDAPIVALDNSEHGLRVDQAIVSLRPSVVALRARTWLASGRSEIDDDYEDMLLDRELLSDFRARVRQLDRNGLAVAENGSVRPSWETCHRRQVWLGTHSFKSEQPERYEIEIDERRARILQRGAQPLNKGYDFGGLHSLLQTAVDEYNSVVNDTRAMDAAARTRALLRIEERIRNIELVYNFLAFVAPPRDAEWYLPATDMLATLRTRADIVAFLRPLVPVGLKLH